MDEPVFPAYGAPFKYIGVMVNSVGIIVSFGLALRLILVGNVAAHRAWMVRAFGLGPATQRLFFIPIFLVYGIMGDFVIELLIWFVFLNLTVVEWLLWRERNRGL